MNCARFVSALGLCFLAAATAFAQEEPKKSGLPAEGYPWKDTDPIPGQKWHVHDKERPEPGIITPGTASTADKQGKAPSDAIVLFNGSDLKEWVNGKGEPAEWKIEDGYMEVNGKGSIKTARKFGSCQLHVEWCSPAEVKGKSQGRGNSGVILMGKYEVQVLDSFNNRSYSDGQASAIYGQYPPLVNASRGPGEWQTYDIIFDAPAYKDGQLEKPGYLTVLHNGVLVHHHRKSLGQVAHKFAPKNNPHPAELPLQLQDHGNPVRFRNIWIRPLKSSTALVAEDMSEEAKFWFTDGKVFDVLFKTTKGDFVVEVHRDWAPLGADHFIDLVLKGFYNDVGFFRAVPDFMVQFGISGDPEMTKEYGETTIKDDDVKESNKRGFITYAKTGAPDSRSTQLFINFKDNSFLDRQGFAPFGKIRGDGMETVDKINKEYGEPPRDAQFKLKAEGNAYLKAELPNVDYLKSATLVAVDGKTIDASMIDFKKYVFRKGSLFKRQEPTEEEEAASEENAADDVEKKEEEKDDDEVEKKEEKKDDDNDQK